MTVTLERLATFPLRDGSSNHATLSLFSIRLGALRPAAALDPRPSDCVKKYARLGHGLRRRDGADTCHGDAGRTQRLQGG
jgi:hypothetical protein